MVGAIYDRCIAEQVGRRMKMQVGEATTNNAYVDQEMAGWLVNRLTLVSLDVVE
jgi:hypothetical protein